MPEGHMMSIEGYWTQRASGYSGTVTEQIEKGTYRHWLNIILEHLGQCGDLDVLDVGTGPGFFPVVLGRLGHRVTGVDCTQAMLDQAGNNCARYGVDAKFKRMDAQVLEFPDETFDLVISRNLVWNLNDPKAAYREWLRVLKPEGKLMIFDVNHYLYLYDKDYASQAPEYAESHDRIGNVDPKIMERIAEELPLSSQRRPQWDVDTLIELGVRTIKVDTDGRDSLKVVKDGETVYLPFSFFICATK